MWSAPAVCMVCILFGSLCDVQQVCSQPRLIQRKTNHIPDEGTELEEDIRKVINQIHSLSDENTRSFSVTPAAEGVNFNAYYNVMNNLYGVFQPLLKDRFIEDLPKTLVCLLSGRQDCGVQAELTKTVSLELGKPLLVFLSSLRSQTCAPLGDDGESSSYFRAYVRAGESRAGESRAVSNGFQQALLNMLSSLSFSEGVLSTVSSIMDVAVTYVFKFLAVLLQAPMDYIRIALQFGIKVPFLDEKQTCDQGDLKQLIMWGIKHNVSWSFGSSLVDILLEILLPPEESPYTNPKCQNPPSAPLQRSVPETKNDTGNSNVFLCDRRDLASFNDTQCVEILTGSTEGSPTSVVTLCRALSSLSPDQIEKMWSNMCYFIQAAMSPLVSRSSDCGAGDVQPSPTVTPYYQTVPVLPRSAPRRAAREASNLQQLACNYNSWLENAVVDVVLVSLCSDNERVEFVRRVCNDAVLMRKLLWDEMNSWLYGYCANSSADLGYMMSQFCMYEEWIVDPTMIVDPNLLQFCMSLDGIGLTQLICQHTGFFMLIFSNPNNSQFMPNCSNMPPPPPFTDYDSNPLQLESCQYSEWHDVMQITTDRLSQCILTDQSGFTREVCSNKTFLNSLLLNNQNAWLEEHCNASLIFSPPEPTQPIDIAGWCDYHTWGEQQVDVSVVGFCWQHDQQAFQKNVCCKPSVFEKLLENPQNRWLASACTDMEEITVSPHVCRYSDWSRPVIVDMTDLALCAEIDSLNFTTKVCGDDTVLQNLLANQDNTWLIQHCANHSDPGVSPGGGGGLGGFDPADQCQYSSWSISPPDPALLTLCWEQDQANFVSSVCPDAGLLLVLSRERSSMWVSSMCTTYTNYTTTTTTDNNNNTTTTTAEPPFCLARDLVEQFNWSCSAYFASACQPCATQNMVLQTIVRCWVENVGSRVEYLLTPPVASLLEQAVSTTVVILLTLEEVQGTSWHVTETIRSSVLQSVVDYFKRETNPEKKRILLQCFGTVLTNLLLTRREVSSVELLLVKEYFSLPLSSLRQVLSVAHISTIRLVLQYYNSNKDTLQFSDKYLSTMVSVLLHTHLVEDGKLFSELAPLLTSASPADIQALPPLQNNSDVRETLNANLGSMTLEQREAFGSWYSRVLPPPSIIRGQQSLIRDTGNLIAYLPFQSFQHLSAAQLLDGLDVLQRNSLTPLKREFIARHLIGSYRNLTAQDFIRLGNISCLADPEDLLLYRNTEAFSVIQDSVMNCTRQGLSLSSILVSNLLLNSSELEAPSSLTAERLSELAPLLPSLGVTFLQNLSASQLLDVLPSLSSIPFTSAQASLIVNKLSSANKLDLARLHELGTLIIGVTRETFLDLTPDRLLSSLNTVVQHTPDPCSPHKHGLSASQANVIATKLWGFKDVVEWLNDVTPLLRCTPLLSVLPRISPLVDQHSETSTKPWNTQQAKAIFNRLLETHPDLIKHDFLSLGTLGQGVSCRIIEEHFPDDSSPSSLRNILAFLRQQPRLLHTSLKKCVIERLYNFEFYSELLEDLGVELALSMKLSTIKKFSKDLMHTLRMMILEDPHPFLLLTRTKQELLVDKMVQKLDMYTGAFTEDEFRSLGIMAPFVADEVFFVVDRSFFSKNLDFFRGFCYSSSKMEIVARILQEPPVFGSVQDWNQTTLSQVDRFLFFLPETILQGIPPELMTVGRIEKLFMSQRQWEQGHVGTHCSHSHERRTIFERQQFVLQFFLGFLKISPLSPAPMVPTCEIFHTTAPSAWPSDSLKSMSPSAFSNCLELMGCDPFLASYQRREVLKRVIKLYGPVSSFSPSLISQLGRIAIELSVEELSSLRLTDRRSVAALGALSEWNNRQLAALFTTALNSLPPITVNSQSPNALDSLTPSQLDSSTLVAMGYIVCGATTTEMKSFNAVEFSKAALWLGQLDLSCSEEQLQALAELLADRMAFGTMDSWGADVFIEIGILAAGLPDFAMSALVKEQIQGIQPIAIPRISPGKLSVAFDQGKISMFCYEQAASVTKDQLSALSLVQISALNMVLTPWEDRPVDFRGRSLGLALSHSPLCLILGLLMLLTDLLCPDT